MPEHKYNIQNECRKDYKEAVCIDADRIYDSCCDKDCLEDLPVYFTDAAQGLINRAVGVRIKSADVINVCIDLEPVNYNRGFYSVDMTYYFDIELEISVSHHAPCTTVHGLSVFNKKVILFGSEGGVRIFSSSYCFDEMDEQEKASRNLPKVTVQVATPIALGAKVVEKCDSCCPCCCIPSCICNRFGGDFGGHGAERTALVSIGIFSIVQIERNVSMLIHAYDFCMPQKCCTESNDENPCDLFKKIRFPSDEFFPPKASEQHCDTGCSCGK